MRARASSFIPSAPPARAQVERVWIDDPDDPRYTVQTPDEMVVDGDRAFTVAWPAGETRWFQAHATDQGWRLESVTTQHPRPSEDEIWQIVVRALPANTLVLRPTWLPEDFTPRLAYLWGANTMSTPTYWLDYRSPSSGRVIAFHRGGGNSAPPISTERILFHGVEAILATTASWPGIELTWSEDGYSYQIQMSKGTREEIMRIADGLTAVTLTANDQRTGDPRRSRALTS